MITGDVYIPKTWEEVIEQLLEIIPERYPDWTDYNVHDPGMTVLELFVWLSQIQMYHAARTGEQHWQKYCKLMGIDRRKPVPGQTRVTVEAYDGCYLEAGSKFYAGSICFENREPQMVEEGIFQCLITSEAGGREQVFEGSWMSGGKGLAIFPFGEPARAGNSLTIGLSRPLAVGRPYCLSLDISADYPVGRRRVREEEFDGYGFYPLADLLIEYQTADGWQAVAVIRDDTYGLIQGGSIRFTLPEAMTEQCCRIRMTLERNDYLVSPKITRISMAQVAVWQQETFSDYARWPATGLPDQVYELDYANLADGGLILEVRDGNGQPGSEAWVPVDDFDCSGPEDPHYQVLQGKIRFGDGFSGKMPEGEICITRLVRTLGAAGNIKSGTIRRLAGKSFCVCNEKDVAGGVSAETAEEAVRRAAAGEPELMRAVTGADYRKLVMEIPGLLIEDCRIYATPGRKRELSIVVKPYTGAVCSYLNEAYRINLYRYLEDKRLIGTRLNIRSPKYYGLEIVCVIEADVRYRDAAAMTEKEIVRWLAGKTFGECLRKGELQGEISAFPWVRRVELLSLEAGSRVSRTEEADLVLPPDGLFWPKKLVCRQTGT